MRVVVLSGCDPSATYLIQRLRKAGYAEDVFRVIWDRPATRRRPRLAPHQAALRRIHDSYLDWRFSQLERDTSRALFGTPQPPALEITETVVASQIDSPELARKLRGRMPDLLVLNGAPILKEAIYGIPRIGTINMHYGIAPEYRGSFTLFWALYHRDYAKLGATLHYVDAGVDSGPVAGYAYPALARDDTEASIMAKCTRCATELLLRHLDQLAAGGDRPRTLELWGTAVSPAYKKRQRNGKVDAQLWLLRHLGIVSIPPRPSSLILFG